MKSIRVIAVGVVCSWIVLQFIYIPFVKYFIGNSKLWILSQLLESSTTLFSPLSTSILMTSLLLLSLSIGMFFAAFLYGPIETRLIAYFLARQSILT